MVGVWISWKRAMMDNHVRVWLALYWSEEERWKGREIDKVQRDQNQPKQEREGRMILKTPLLERVATKGLKETWLDVPLTLVVFSLPG